MSIEETTGNLEPGKDADFVVINIPKLEAATGRSARNLQEILAALCSVKSRLEAATQEKARILLNRYISEEIQYMMLIR